MQKRYFLKEDAIALDAAITKAKRGSEAAKKGLATSFREQASAADNTSHQQACHRADLATSRLGMLNEIRQGIVIVNPSDDVTRVAIGRKVTLKDTGTGNLETYFVASFWVSEENHSDEVRISYASPIAHSIMCARVGEEREIILSPKKTLRVQVVEIE